MSPRPLRAVIALATVGLCVGGCAMPTWVPFIGKAKKDDALVNAPAPKPAPEAPPRPRVDDETISDRVLAVVNNDAITLSEVQENMLMYKSENRGRVTQTDDELAKQILTRLIDTRLQVQEADREKIVIDEAELNEEVLERAKRFGVTTKEEFEAMVKSQGLSVDAVKKRLRDQLRIQKVVRRKVVLRVSVTEGEIDQYFTENRQKLETGLSYHARHILLQPPTDDDAGWEATRIRAELIRNQVVDGADFAELARQHSRDASAKDGGDLGTLRHGELAEEIESKILALGPGQTSVPFRSSLGYHIFRLEAKESLEGEGLQRARAQIREILLRQKYEARQDAWLKEVRQRAIIEIRM
ncbi:MAG: peptidylprolyl isomerase [Candidatus Rokubacteria bacterium]|nr:peptidylprolyl isomerase [Candidatus Rokubacteria bacterium]